jgi:glycerophosphoryl diester phosphodiesterase
MKKLILLFIILFSFTCKKETFNIVNLNGNKIITQGHGGMGPSSTYPTDSYESLMECLSLGADGTEFDVQLTRDSVLVLYHDHDLSNNTTIKGCINSLSWSEVRTARYNQTLYLNYSIISLDEFFSHVANPDRYTFTFDCKLYTENVNTGAFYRSYIDAVIRLVHQYGLKNNVYIESQDPNFLALFKKKDPAFRLFIYPSSFEEGLEAAISAGLYGITISTRDITKEQIKMAHDLNLWITLWSIHTEDDNKEAIRKNPDCIQTDKLKHLVKLLK